MLYGALADLEKILMNLFPAFDIEGTLEGCVTKIAAVEDIWPQPDLEIVCYIFDGLSI